MFFGIIYIFPAFSQLVLLKICMSTIFYHRNLDGFRRMSFWGLLRKKSLEEIFNKYGLWPEINHRIIGI